VTDPYRRVRVQTAITAGVMLAAAAALATSGTPEGHAAAIGASAQASQGPLAPFAANPVVIPLDQPTPGTRAVPKPPAQGATVNVPKFTLPANLGTSTAGIPRRVLAAFVSATHEADQSAPQCRLQWQTLAAIGYIESDDAIGGGSLNPHWNGVAFPPILGPLLAGGKGIAAIADTDHGTLDGNAQWDRAIGPMQFLPSTWTEYAADGNHDGVSDPQDIDDSTLAAGHYLCAVTTNLNQPKPRIRAIYAYNHSTAYVRDVLTVAAHYEHVNPVKLGIKAVPRGHEKKKHPHAKAKAHKTPASTTSNQPTASSSPTPPSSGSPTPTPTKKPSPTPTPNPTRATTPTACPTPSAPSPSPSPTATGVLVAPDLRHC
jgi:membrane-bound lytic murein transglycosylase B